MAVPKPRLYFDFHTKGIAQLSVGFVQHLAYRLPHP